MNLARAASLDFGESSPGGLGFGDPGVFAAVDEGLGEPGGRLRDV